MANTLIPGMFRIYVRSPTGNSTKVFEQRSEAVGQLTGSPAGAIAQTPEKWLVCGLAGDPNGNYFYGGCELVVEFTPDAAVTACKNADHRWIIPITLDNGAMITLAFNTTSFNAYVITTASAIAAGLPVTLAVHRAPEGRNWLFGGGSIYMSFMET